MGVVIKTEACMWRVWYQDPDKVITPWIGNITLLGSYKNENNRQYVAHYTYSGLHDLVGTFPSRVQAVSAMENEYRRSKG